MTAAGLFLLLAAERRFDLVGTLAGCIREWCDPAIARSLWIGGGSPRLGARQTEVKRADNSILIGQVRGEGRIQQDDEGRYNIIARQSEKTAPAANSTRRPGTARFPVPGSAHP